MKKLFLTISVITNLILVLFPLSIQSIESRAAPAVLANTCAGCHGTDGKSAGSIPSLRGIKFNEFVKTMKAFRADERKGTVMNRIARGYTDEEIDAMAKYFSELK